MTRTPILVMLLLAAFTVDVIAAEKFYCAAIMTREKGDKVRESFFGGKDCAIAGGKALKSCRATEKCAIKKLIKPGQCYTFPKGSAGGITRVCLRK